MPSVIFSAVLSVFGRVIFWTILTFSPSTSISVGYWQTSYKRAHRFLSWRLVVLVAFGATAVEFCAAGVNLPSLRKSNLVCALFLSLSIPAAEHLIEMSLAKLPHDPPPICQLFPYHLIVCYVR